MLDTDRPRRRILAVVIGLGPVFGLVIGSHLATGGTYSLTQMLVYPLVFGTAAIVWLGWLYRSYCGLDFARINRRPGRIWTDIPAGIGLAAALLLVWFFQRFTIDRWFPRPPAEPWLLNLLGGLSRDPLLLAVWLGPVVWIGVAAFEEIQRVFTLDLLDDLHSSRGWKAVILILSAALFGLVHIYQGPAGMIGNFIFGIAMGLYYFGAGRIWPMIIGHALYDSAQIILGVIEIRKAGF